MVGRAGGNRLTARLFERTNGGTRPTPEGLECLGAAKHILGEAEALATRVKTRSRGESGRLAIGV
jgi:DNA-binding transcriptional LysR family regulator